MAWAGGGAGAALAISATDTDVAEVLADVAEVLADVAGDSAAWCSEGALQPTANNVEHIANTRIGVRSHGANARAIPRLVGYVG